MLRGCHARFQRGCHARFRYTFGAMLKQLSIANYATVESLAVAFHRGMSVLTGETGAGKSIIVGALGLALGARAGRNVVRSGAEKTAIAAEFDISGNDSARSWLETNDLPRDPAGVCLIRRSIAGDGRSRAFINDSPVTMASLQQLGALLVDIVSQQEHQSLLRRQTQLELLDDYCVERELLGEMRSLYRAWQANERAIAELRGGDNDSHVELLSYQSAELEQLGVEAGEVEALEGEHRRLSNAGEALAALAGVASLIADNESGNALDSLHQGRQMLEALQDASSRVANALELLESAGIQLEEAATDLRSAADEFPIDPERLSQVDERLGKLHDMARKHKVRPAELAHLTQSLAGQLREIQGRGEALQRLEEQGEKLREQYAAVAGRVGKQRREGAGRLVQAIEAQIASLGMGKASMDIRFESLGQDAVAAHGLEKVEFLVAANPGQSPGPLASIASGGELSRISLAIRVVTAGTSRTPSLVFDEVDVGIGGGVAAQVGELLRSLGESAQVLCVTHQPQVASRAHRHYSVSKDSDDATTRSSIRQLDAEARVLEIARMLAGEESGRATLAHARQMLAVDQPSA